MLVFSRQRDEETVLILPDKRLIIATIVDIRGDKVRIGWTAPVEIPIHRREVFDAIMRETPTIRCHRVKIDTPPERNPDASR